MFSDLTPTIDFLPVASSDGCESWSTAQRDFIELSTAGNLWLAIAALVSLVGLIRG